MFAASGVDPAEDGKAAIAERVRRWRFETVTSEDEQDRAAVRRAATHLREHPDDAPGPPARTATQRAVAAVELRRRFLKG